MLSCALFLNHCAPNVRQKQGDFCLCLTLFKSGKIAFIFMLKPTCTSSDIRYLSFGNTNSYMVTFGNVYGNTTTPNILPFYPRKTVI